MQHISILGAGAFGTAIAQLLAINGHDVTLWCHDAEKAKNITKNPATFENLSAKCGFEENLTLDNPIIKSTGIVPKANAPIINAPLNMFPESKAKLCAVIVNPQGKKKVNTPITNGIYFP